jgi:hypothetical protein
LRQRLVLLCSPDWPWTIDPPASAFWVLGLHVCTPMSRIIVSLTSINVVSISLFCFCCHFCSNTRPVWSFLLYNKNSLLSLYALFILFFPLVIFSLHTALSGLA